MRPFICALLLLTVSQAPQSRPSYDVLIVNGHVVDGTGSPWYAADVGIRNGRIAAIGRLAGAPASSGSTRRHGRRARLHRHARPVGADACWSIRICRRRSSRASRPRSPAKADRSAPLNDAIVKADKVDYDHLNITPDWRTLAQYFARLEKQGLGINLATYVGATQVRRMVLGDADRQPTPAELDRMKALVREAMEQGARRRVDVAAVCAGAVREDRGADRARQPRPRSTAASTRRTCARKAAACSTRSTKRSASAARRRFPVEIWHIKAAGKPNWGRMKDIVAEIEQARRDGVDITADTYAYPAWFNSMSAFIPPWAHDGGDETAASRG